MAITTNLLTTSLAARLLSWIGPTWRVFAACLLFTVIGVAASLFVFPPTGTLRGSQLFTVGIVIAFAMMLVSYGAKYSNTETRDHFTPIDLLQYTVQGFLWPATWPALAEKLGQVVIEPAPTTSLVLQLAV